MNEIAEIASRVDMSNIRIVLELSLPFILFSCVTKVLFFLHDTYPIKNNTLRVFHIIAFAYSVKETGNTFFFFFAGGGGGGEGLRRMKT